MLEPMIETERLVLRLHQMEDFGECAAMWSDPLVTRHIGGKPFSAEEVWTKILRYAGHWALLGYGFWVARDRTSGRFVGEVGFADFKRDITPSFEGTPEIGWVLAQWAWGRGLATEAVRAALAWLEAQRAFSRTVCMIRPDNQASVRVAKKCGYREWQQAAYRGTTVILFERGGTTGSSCPP